MEGDGAPGGLRRVEVQPIRFQFWPIPSRISLRMGNGHYGSHIAVGGLGWYF